MRDAERTDDAGLELGQRTVDGGGRRRLPGAGDQDGGCPSRQEDGGRGVISKKVSYELVVFFILALVLISYGEFVDGYISPAATVDRYWNTLICTLFLSFLYFSYRIYKASCQRNNLASVMYSALVLFVLFRAFFAETFHYYEFSARSLFYPIMNKCQIGLVRDGYGDIAVCVRSMRWPIVRALLVVKTTTSGPFSQERLNRIVELGGCQRVSENAMFNGAIYMVCRCE